MLFENQYATFC